MTFVHNAPYVAQSQWANNLAVLADIPRATTRRIQFAINVVGGVATSDIVEQVKMLSWCSAARMLKQMTKLEEVVVFLEDGEYAEGEVWPRVEQVLRRELPARAKVMRRCYTLL